MPRVIVTVRHLDEGVELVVGDLLVRADASAHTIALTSSAGLSLELGALRSGVLSACGVVAEELEVPLQGYDYSPVSRAIEDALARAAGRRGLRDASLEAAIAQIYPTPLVHSASFLEARYVWQDALRFRACRVAIANAEDDVIDEHGPAVATGVVERLQKWRELFIAPDASKKAVNAALNDFGETLAAEALWGLRRVPLQRRRDRPLHLSVLGWLGAIPGTAGMDAIIATVERANDADLDAAISECGARADAQSVAFILSLGDPASASLPDLLRSVDDRMTEEVNGALAFPSPPVALPAEQGIGLIRTAKQLREEGQRMHHCVASRARDCADGVAFVFHIERDGSHGTVHVDQHGRVVEARGPFNRASQAASWGAQVLGAWGARFWIEAYSPDALAWPRGLRAPAEAKALMNVRMIFAAFNTAADRDPKRIVALRDWFVAATARAVRGEVGLYAQPKDPAQVFLVDAEGRILGDSSALVMPARMRRIPPPIEQARIVGLDGQAFQVPPRVEARLIEWRAAPPTPLPAATGVRLVETGEQWWRLQQELHFTAPEADPRLATGAAWALDCRSDRGVVVVEVDAAALTSRVVAHRGGDPRDVDWALDRARRWTRSFWASRLGLARTTWSGAMRAPITTEPLKNVEECATLYRATMERTGDRDGALAAFYERHVGAAVRGTAWLVVRDRARGLVSVLDAQRKVVATTDALVGPA